MPLTEQQMQQALMNLFSIRVKRITDYNNPLLALQEIGVHFPSGVMFVRDPDTGNYIKPNEMNAAALAMINAKYDIGQNLLSSDILGSTRMYANLAALNISGDPTFAKLFTAMADNSMLVHYVVPGSNFYNLLPNTVGGVLVIYKRGDNLYLSFNAIDAGSHHTVYTNTGSTVKPWNDFARIETVHTDLYDMDVIKITHITSGAKMGIGKKTDNSNIDISATLVDGLVGGLEITAKAHHKNLAVVFKDQSNTITSFITLPEMAIVGAVADTFNAVTGMFTQRVRVVSPVGSTYVDLTNTRVYTLSDTAEGTITSNLGSAVTTETNQDNLAYIGNIFKSSDNKIKMICAKDGSTTRPTAVYYTLNTPINYKYRSFYPKLVKDGTISVSSYVEFYDQTLAESVILIDTIGVRMIQLVSVEEYNTTYTRYASANISADGKSIEGLKAQQFYRIIAITDAVTGTIPKIEYEYLNTKLPMLEVFQNYVGNLSKSSAATPSLGGGSGGGGGLKIESATVTINSETDLDIPFASYVETDALLLVYNTTLWWKDVSFTVDMVDRKIVKSDGMEWTIGDSITMIHIGTTISSLTGVAVEDMDHAFSNTTGTGLTQIPYPASYNFNKDVDGFDLIYMGVILIKDVDYIMDEDHLTLLRLVLPTETPNNDQAHIIYRRVKRLGRLSVPNSTIDGSQVNAGTITRRELDSDLIDLFDDEDKVDIIDFWPDGKAKTYRYIRPSGIRREDRIINSYDTNGNPTSITRKTYDAEGVQLTSKTRTLQYTNGFRSYGYWIND